MFRHTKEDCLNSKHECHRNTNVIVKRPSYVDDLRPLNTIRIEQRGFVKIETRAKKLDVRKSNVTAVTKHRRRVSTETATGMTVTATIMTATIMTVTAHISRLVL